MLWAGAGWWLLRALLLAVGVPWPYVAALGARRSRLLAVTALLWVGGPWASVTLGALELEAFCSWRRGRRRARRAGRGL